MFDTLKVQKMTVELEHFARAHKKLYLYIEDFKPDIFMLIRRMKINISAILINTQHPIVQKQIHGFPLIRFYDILQNFDSNVGIIAFGKKVVSDSQTNLMITLGDYQVSIPTFVLTLDEILAIYDRLNIIQLIQKYSEDGINDYSLENIATRLVRGLTTFIDSEHQEVKVQILNKQCRNMPKYEFNDVAIVMQGPIIYENNFTIKTAQFYRKLYPNAPIIMSIWRGEATDKFRLECIQNSIVLLEIEQPANPGYGHINWHLEGVLKGIKYVRNSTNAYYVLKCRNDQRINQPDFLLYFRNLLQIYPPPRAEQAAG